jgi:hypothetical protein
LKSAIFILFILSGTFQLVLLLFVNLALFEEMFLCSFTIQTSLGLLFWSEKNKISKPVNWKRNLDYLLLIEQLSNKLYTYLLRSMVNIRMERMCPFLLLSEHDNFLSILLFQAQHKLPFLIKIFTEIQHGIPNYFLDRFGRCRVIGHLAGFLLVLLLTRSLF